MVYFLYGFYDIFSLTELAYRVLLDVKLPYPSPSVTVSFVGVRITLVLVVMLGYHFAMFLTVRALRKFRASAEPTRTFRCLWHIIYSLFLEYKNALGFFSKSIRLFFAIITISHYHTLIL